MSSNTNRRHRFGTAGTASLEFGLVAGAFLLLTLGGIDFGRYFLTVQSLHTLTSSVARATMVGTVTAGSCPTTIPSSITALVPMLNPASVTTCVTSTTAGGISTVTVTSSYPFQFILPALNMASGNIGDTDTMKY